MKTFLVCSVTSLLLVAAGCGDLPYAPERRPDTQQNQYSPVATEPPPFVEHLLERYSSPEAITMADVQPMPGVANQPSVNDTSYDMYSVTLLWGQFYDFPVTLPPTNWSGSLWVNGEAIVSVLSTIDFEPGEDSIVPDNLPYSEAWVSMTSREFDGVTFLVFLKRGVIYIMAPTLHFETAPFKLELDFGQLEEFTALYVVDEANAVAVHARKLKRFMCPGGLITGKWIKDENSGASGRMEGLWQDKSGRPEGVLAGRFWSNADGTREFSGWWSGYFTDQIIGEFKGTWYYDDPSMCPVCGEGYGRFKGKFSLLAADGVGELEGEFGQVSIPFDVRELEMNGVWRMRCADIAVSSAGEK